MALSTTRTLLTQTGINTHQVFNVGGLDSAGIATFSNFKTGTTNVHNVGIELAGINVLGGDTPIGTGATIFRDGGANFSGIVSATTFSGAFTGDGQNLTGLPAGLGTALSNTQTLALNKVYYTDKVLSISTTTTVDPPTSASVAYTQYTDIKIEDGHDLIIRDGDELRPDVLGLSTTKTLDTNNFPDGLRGNLIGNVTGDVTGDVTGNINNSSNLLLKTGGTERLRIDSSGHISQGGGATPASTNGAIGLKFGIKSTQNNVIIGETTQSGTGYGLHLESRQTGRSGNARIAQIGLKNDASGNGQISFFTAASGADVTERMVIDSSGNVTKPNNFHILVKRSGNQTGYSATYNSNVIVWNNVVTGESSPNAANHFDTSTGLFTAPVTGLYFFHAAVLCDFAPEEAWLVYNGSRPNYSNFKPNAGNNADGNLIYHVTAGDTVGLKWYRNATTGTITANDLHTWWRIALLG